jgi:hypothetical protein
VHVTVQRIVVEPLAAERGGVLVLTGLLIPVLLLLVSFTVDIGNWWAHKRHLQMQVDAAALAGGARFGECFSNPAGAEAAISGEATKYGGGSGSLYNAMVAGPLKGTMALSYQDKFWPSGAGPDDSTETGNPCTTPSFMFDVKGSEIELKSLFVPGLDLDVNAQARVQLRTVTVQKGMLPVSVPDLRFNYAFATFVDEATGTALATSQLQVTGTTGGQQLWSSPAPVDVAVTGRVGVRLRLVGGTDPNAACGQLYVDCYDAGSANGLVHIRGWNSLAPAPAARNVWMLPGTCAPDAYFTTADCSAGIQAEVDLGLTHPLTGPSITSEVWASVDGSGKYPLTPGGVAGLVTWTAASGVPVTGEGPHDVSLHWSWQQTTGTWLGDTCKTGGGNPCKASGTFGTVQRAFRGGPDRSGPVKRVQVFESGVSTSGANSFALGSLHSLGVSISVTGSLKVQSDATDPVIELRVVGSQNQSIDCDPEQPNLADEIENGCAPEYEINPGISCPAYNELWSLPQPWQCVKTQTGGAVGQVAKGLEQRILGGAKTCTAPINWPNYSPGDPRIVPLIITPFGSFSGSGNSIVPVIDFGVFYVVGWDGDPCPGAHPTPKGYIAGHFVKYAAPNPNADAETVCDPDALTPCVAVMTR